MRTLSLLLSEVKKQVGKKSSAGSAEIRTFFVFLLHI
jgi:hypothetical protein